MTPKSSLPTARLFCFEDADDTSSHLFMLLITKQDHYQAAIAKAKQTPSRRLYVATTEGDVEGAAKAIYDGANVNTWLYANYKRPFHFALSEDQVEIARLLLDVGANVSVFEFNDLAAVQNSRPIPKAMDLVATDSRLKEGWYASVEERRAREERSKNYDVGSLLRLLKFKAGDQVCSSMLGVWLKGTVVQRRGDDIQVQVTSHGPASAAVMGNSWQPCLLRS